MFTLHSLHLIIIIIAFRAANAVGLDRTSFLHAPPLCDPSISSRRRTHSIKRNHDLPRFRPSCSFKKLSAIVHAKPRPGSNYVACFVVKTLGKVLKVGVRSLKLLR